MDGFLRYDVTHPRHEGPVPREQHTLNPKNILRFERSIRVDKDLKGVIYIEGLEELIQGSKGLVNRLTRCPCEVDRNT